VALQEFAPSLMKPSKYNYVVPTYGRGGLFFNFYTLNLILFPEREKAIALSLLKRPNQFVLIDGQKRIKGLLAEKGFLLDQSVREISLLKESHQRAAASTNHLSLTIAPTLRCNFRCTYCYQTGQGPTMTEDAAKAILVFINDRLAPNTGLSITWFGGEPLLMLPMIEALTAAFRGICTAKGASYSASMITNGYLLNKANVKRILSAGIRKVQITIDGPAETHNSRRIVKGSGTSFDTILKNIQNAQKDLAISLRMNVDKSNRDKIDDLMEILVRKGLEKRLGLYIGQVQPYTEVCKDVAGCCLTDREFSLVGLQTLLHMTQKGFTSTFNYPRSANTHCMADQANSFVITPTGGVTKCWNEVGRQEAEIGHLLNPLTKDMKKNAQRWHKRDPFKLECRNCNLLPICMGGCPYRHLEQGSLDCHRWKGCLDESILTYFYLRKMETAGKIATTFKDVENSIREMANHGFTRK